MIRKHTAIIVLVAFVITGGSCAGSHGDNTSMEAAAGFITGQVNIGPVRPVATPEKTTGINMYKDRRLVIYNSEMQVVKKLAIADDGSFAGSLPAGEYKLQITLRKLERVSGLPEMIRIDPGDTRKLVIDIDTGIR
jgi:hypothetical protein